MPKDMRVLVVTQYFWPEPFRINDLVLGLKDLGHDVNVLTGIPNYPSGRFYPGYGLFSPLRDSFEGVTVYRMPMMPKGNGNALHMALYYLSLALSGSVLAPFLLGKKVDLIFVYQPSPITIGLPARVMKMLSHAPILFWVQDIWPETLSGTGMVRSPFVLKSVEKMVKFIYAGCDRILVQSRAFSERIQNMKVPKDKIFYYPNSAEELYQPVKVESDAVERELIPDGFRVMFAGNIGKAQDFPTVLSAAETLKNYPEIKWIVLGDGTMRSWVEEEVKARKLNDTVHLLGRHPVKLMPRFFSLADVLLVTLKRDPIFALTIPAKVQSYLACAKPILAALDGEGAKVIEESGGGMTAPAGDAEALAEIVLKMYRMPKAELDRIGQLARAYFERHFERNSLLDRLDSWMTEEVSK
jgi:glycosyltransferase involved in cell wall biosynthesis